MRKDREKTKLPIFGVGPVYVISCLILTYVDYRWTIMAYWNQVRFQK